MLGIGIASRSLVVCGLLQIDVNPSTVRFTGTADSAAGIQRITISPPVGSDKPVEFSFSGVTPRKPGDPEFVVVSPSSGVAPAVVWVALNPNVVPYLSSGSHSVILGFAPTGQPSTTGAGVIVNLDLNAKPPPTITSVINAATLQPTISPGELITIMGAHLSTPSITAQYNSAGLYPKQLGSSAVTFNGIAAPLLYVSTGQIIAVIPFGVAGQKTVDIVVTHNLAQSSAFTVPLMDTSPGIFTATQNGTGQGAILDADILNPSIVTVNGVDNPASKRSAITIFATGGGLWNGGVQDGSIFITTNFLGSSRPMDLAAPVSLTIGGQTAQLLYVGASPFRVFGTLQINAIVPAGVDSGPQLLVLTIGQNNNAAQQVTVAVL